MKRVPVRFYGLMRRYFEAGPAQLEIEIPEDRPITVQEVRKLIARALTENTRFKAGEAGILDDCAISDERRVLSESASVTACRELSVLPPVCGG